MAQKQASTDFVFLLPRELPPAVGVRYLLRILGTKACVQSHGHMLREHDQTGVATSAIFFSSQQPADGQLGLVRSGGSALGEKGSMFGRTGNQSSLGPQHRLGNRPILRPFLLPCGRE